VLRASGTARPMTERPDEHRLLAQYLTEIRKKPLVTPAQELALGEQKNQRSAKKLEFGTLTYESVC
jgi:Sigma-70 factor, region 1.2